MTKKELADRIIEQNGGNPLVTHKKLMQIFNLGYKKVHEVIKDVPPVTETAGNKTRARYYFVDDVAEAIMRKGL